MPRFDVVQCGMGAAAHTASLFPGEPLLDDRAGIAAAVFAPQSRQWRVTLLPGPLLAARHVVYLGREPTRPKPCGPCFKRRSNRKKYPSQLIDRGAEWFLDKAATALM